MIVWGHRAPRVPDPGPCALAGITDVLSDVERRADELNRRAAELVQGWL